MGNAVSRNSWVKMKQTLYIVLGTFTILLLIDALEATDYVLISEDRKFFTPCTGKDRYGDIPITQVLDTSGLKHTDDPDQETVYTNGNILVKTGWPKNVPIKVELEIYERKHGEWVDTIYSIRRDDFCKAIFDPNEFWYSLMSQIPPEQRICPPKPGTKYTMSNVSNRIDMPNMPHSAMLGEYKAIVHWKFATHGICMSSRFNIYKK